MLTDIPTVTLSAPSENSRGGTGGGGYTWPYTGLKYASGGGGSSYQPSNNPAEGGGDEAGRGTVFNGGDEMFNGGTAPTGAPLPPYGSKIGFGDTPGDNAAQSKRALANRGGGGGGAFNGGSYYGFPATIRLGVGPLSPSPYPGGLGGGAVWPSGYPYGSPGAPTWRGRDSGSEGGSGGSGGGAGQDGTNTGTPGSGTRFRRALHPALLSPPRDSGPGNCGVAPRPWSAAQER